MNRHPALGILTKLVAIFALICLTLALGATMARADSQAFLDWETRVVAYEAAVVALVEEAQSCTTKQCFANYMGEVFSITVAERQVWWTGIQWDACMQKLGAQYLAHLDGAALLYAGVYYNMTAEVGTTTVDVDLLYQTWNVYLNEAYSLAVEPARKECGVNEDA